MKKIFLLITIFCFLSGHLLLFFVWRYYLKLSPSGDFYLALFIIGAAVLTALAPVLISWWDNLITRAIYFIAGLWGGIILNSLLLFLTFLLINNLLIFLGLNLDFKTIAWLYFSLQVPLLIGEFLAAYHWRIRRLTILIKDLPPSWEGKRTVHISDVHLGPIWRYPFFRRLLEKIKELRPDAIFITGDLFDGRESDFSWLNNWAKKLQAPLGIYYSFGNHDEELGSAKVRELLSGGDIKVLENEMVEKNGLQIIGLICGHNLRFDVKKAILNQLGYDPSKPSVLLFHEPRDLPSARQAGIDLQLSGHTHGGQMFPFNLVNKLLYSGCDFGVFKRDSLILSVSSGAGTWGPPLRLGSRSEIVEITLRALKD